MKPRLKVKNINKTFGKTKAVDDMSFEVNEGEIMGILGPNGAGKTTTIRMIMGINAPDNGNIYYNVNGSNTDEGKKIPKSRIGYLPEERGLYKDARVMDILTFLSGLKLVEKDKACQKAEEWLEKFDLLENKNNKIEELSKGMAQKVQFIACILHEPDLIVLDEPFSGLDPVSQDVFQTEIRALADRGTAVLLSSHRLNMVEEICDRIFLIHKGKKVLYGPLAEIKNRYGNYRAKLKIANLNNKPDKKVIESLLSNPELVVDYSKQNNVWNLLLREDIEPADFASSIKVNASIKELNISQISLHDIFVKVAKGGDDGENGF